MGVMDRYKEKKKKTDEEESKNTSGGVAERYKLNQYYQTLDVDSVDDSFINAFTADTNSFFNRVGENAISYGEVNSTMEELGKRYDTIQGWLYKNKSKLSEEAYTSLSSTLDGLKSSFDGVKGFYSQWESEDDYNAWSASQKDRDEKLVYDIDAGQSELDELLEVQKVYNENMQHYQQFLLSGDTEDNASFKMIERWLSDARFWSYRLWPGYL